MMKKLLLIACLLGFVLISHAQNNSKNSDQYYVFTGWEESAMSSYHKNQPIVSNVTYNRCQKALGVAAETQFKTFWKAFYKKDNAVIGISAVGHSFETQDKAEAYRRKAVADFNSTYRSGSSEKYQTILVTDFSFTCE